DRHRRTQVAGRRRLPGRQGPVRPGPQPGPALHRPATPPRPDHDRPGRLRGHRRRATPDHQHPGTATDPPRRPATARPRADPADRRRDQTPDQSGHPSRAAAGPPPTMVMVATPTPSPRPLVSPPNSTTPQPSTSTNMTTSQSAAAVLSTVVKHGINAMTALRDAITGNPWTPPAVSIQPVRNLFVGCGGRGM